MKQFPGGWLSLENSFPQVITPIISYCSCNFGGPTIKGVIDYSSIFNTPTGGTWVPSPISISQEPIVIAVNSVHNSVDLLEADAMNSQTKMSNLNSSTPIQLRNFVYLYNNQSTPKWMTQILFDLGANNYNKLQISVFENSVSKGDSHGNIQVIDFGSGPFSGVGTFNFLFGEFHGLINLGIRLESTTNQSSIF